MSILLKVNSPDRMSLLDLWRLVFKYTFDKDNCGFTTKQTIETNLLKWNDLIKYQKRIMTESLGPGFDGYAPIGKKGSLIDEMEYQVGLMCSWLVREEKGELQNKVDTVKRHKLDYRLIEPCSKVFPECNKIRNFKGALASLKQAMKDNPSDYERN